MEQLEDASCISFFFPAVAVLAFKHIHCLDSCPIDKNKQNVVFLSKIKFSTKDTYQTFWVTVLLANSCCDI